jgi:hypothetical protein
MRCTITVRRNVAFHKWLMEKDYTTREREVAAETLFKIIELCPEVEEKLRGEVVEEIVEE